MFKTFEYIFGVDNTVPIDVWIDLGEIIIRLFIQVHFCGKPCQSLLLSTSILNDKYMHNTKARVLNLQYQYWTLYA